jgi:hypothetical protein
MIKRHVVIVKRGRAQAPIIINIRINNNNRDIDKVRSSSTTGGTTVGGTTVGGRGTTIGGRTQGGKTVGGSVRKTRSNKSNPAGAIITGYLPRV